MLLAALTACNKKDEVQPDNNGNNRINFVIADNLFNFSYFNTALERTGYLKKLAGEGPFTVLVPDNIAFNRSGYGNHDALLTESLSILNNMVSYHILGGKWEFNKLPFSFNQEIRTDAGARMFVTRWVKNADTILMINGTRITARNLPASNGLIQVMSEVLPPLVNKTVSDAVAADTSLTLLNVALQQSGMKEQLASDEVYTLMVPSNRALRAAGYGSIDKINAEDPAVLRRLLSYTMFKGRKFVYDYILTTSSTNQSEQAMLNGNNIIIKVISKSDGTQDITLKGTGNAQPANIVKRNVLAGNGVLHVVDALLKENQ